MIWSLGQLSRVISQICFYVASRKIPTFYVSDSKVNVIASTGIFEVFEQWVVALSILVLTSENMSHHMELYSSLNHRFISRFELQDGLHI
jgi:hypothetical protein